jgi:hypothetical protein
MARSSSEQRWLNAAAKVARINQQSETVMVRVEDKLYLPIATGRRVPGRAKMGSAEVHKIDLNFDLRVCVFPYRQLTSIGRVTVKTTRGDDLYRTNCSVMVDRDGIAWMSVPRAPYVAAADFMVSSVLSEFDDVLYTEGWKANKVSEYEQYKVGERVRAVTEWATDRFAMDDEGNVYGRLRNPVFQLFCKRDHGYLSVTTLFHDQAHYSLPYPDQEIGNLGWVDTGLMFPPWEFEAMEALLKLLATQDRVHVQNPVDHIVPSLRDKLASAYIRDSDILQAFASRLHNDLIFDFSQSALCSAGSKMTEAAEDIMHDKSRRKAFAAAVEKLTKQLAKPAGKPVFEEIAVSTWPLPISPFEVLRLRAESLVPASSGKETA